MSLQEEMLSCARKAGGALRTREHRERIVREFCCYLRQQNIQTRHVRDIKVRQIQAYVGSMNERELTLRTMQNSLAAVRTVLTAAGRDAFAEHRDLSNAALGISGASRDGTHAPVTEDFYLQVRESILKYDPTGGIAAVMGLQRVFGLRSLEALCAQGDTLRRWEKEIRRGKIEVIKGTKGGRPRNVTVVNPKIAQIALREAMDVLQATDQDYLVIGKSHTLKSGYDRYHRCLRKYGLRGPSSSHGLRYAWAHQAILYYREERGFSGREALAAVAQDLGHGDGRGRYVAQVYYGRRKEGA